MAKIKFNFNKKKAIEIVLYIAEKKGGIDELSLNKLLFFADEYHINKYGRPLCGGHYVAMKMGPVPSQIRDMIKNDEFNFKKTEYWIAPNRKYNKDYLSESDIEAIDYVLEKYNYANYKLVDISHSHPAWEKARKKCILSKSEPINYEDMIVDNKELIEDLIENSKYIAI